MDLIVSGSNDRTARLWDRKTGLPIKHFNLSYSKIYCVASAVIEGRLVLIVGGSDKLIRVFDVYRNLLIRVLAGHKNDIRALAVTSDGKYLISASYDKKIFIWNLVTGKKSKVLSHHRLGINTIALSPDDKLLASAGIDKEVVLWDLFAGKVLKTFLGHRDQITDLKFSSDQKFLLSGSEDRTIRIWEISTGKIQRILLDNTNFAENIFIDDNSTKIVTGGRDKSIHVWDFNSGKKLGLIHGHFDEIRSINSFPGENNVVITTSDDGTIRIFDTERLRQIQLFEGHTGYVTSSCIISGYNPANEEDSTEIQTQMMAGSFPDYYTYSQAQNKGIKTFEEYIQSTKITKSSKRRVKEIGSSLKSSKEKAVTEKVLRSDKTPNFDKEFLIIINNIKSYKTFNSVEKELKKAIKKKFGSIPKDLNDQMKEMIELLEKHKLIEIGSRGRSKTVKKIEDIKSMPN